MIRFSVSRPCPSSLEHALVADALESNQLTYGPMCKSFERGLADFLHAPHALATSSGTTALHLALAALNIGPGDEVLVPDLTFVATANAVRYVGATPVLCDVSPSSWTIDPDDAIRRITARTRAIIPVHLYGAPCDMEAIWQISDTYNLWIIEDAAEGFGGSGLSPRFHHAPLGTIGHVGAFSFYGNKIITTGEGGAVVTIDNDLADRLRLLRGQAVHPTRRYYHTEVGFNFRMSDLQAAVGLGQLSHLPQMLSRRRHIVDVYCRCLGIDPPCAGDTAAPWLFTFAPEHVSNDWRDRMAERLLERGIETRPVFVPFHRLPMYRDYGTDAEFPVSSRLGDRGLSLPTYPDLPISAVEEICSYIVPMTG